MNKIKEKIKQIKRQIRYIPVRIMMLLHLKMPLPEPTERQKKLFDSLETGDIVLSTMPLNIIELDRIKDTSGHTARPYLVAKKLNDCIFAYQCSSKKYNKSGFKNQYKLPHIRYRQYKVVDKQLVETDSYVDLRRAFILHPCHLQQFMYKVEEADLEMIERKLIAINKEDLVHFDVPFRVVEGDVYEYHGEYYYTYKFYKNSLNCYRMLETDKEGRKTIRIKEKHYIPDLDHKEMIELEDSRLVHVSSPEEKRLINTRLEEKQKQEHLLKTEEKRKKKKEKVYYCRTDIGNVYMDKEGREMIYMYSCNGRDYGIDYQLLMDFDRIKVIPFKTISLDSPQSRMEDEDLMLDVMDAMIENNNRLEDYFNEVCGEDSCHDDEKVYSETVIKDQLKVISEMI